MKKSKLYGSRLIEDNKLTITPELVTLESTDDVTNLTFDRGDILDAASIKLYLAATSDDLTTKYNTLNENVTTNSNDIITINTLLTTTAESINSINANITTINNSLVDYGIALEYVDNKLILKNKNSDTLSSIDLSTMTEDTYLDTVTFSNNKLIFTWNEGSSKKPITIDLSRLKDKDGNELSVGNILAKSKLLFLSKNDSDTAKGLITFMKGVRIGNYTSESGGIIDIDLITGLTYLEVDKLKVRMKAYFETLSIINELSIAGKWTISPGGSILCTRVNITAELNYKCYFTNILDNVQIENKFAVNDLAISKDFNIKTVEYQSATNHYYWRKVLEVGEDYIVLSKTDCDTGSDAPNVGDVICQLGNTTDADRLNALVFSSVDETSPCVNLYSGINTYSLANKEYVSYGVNKTTNKAFMNVYGDMYFGDRPTADNLYEGASYVKFNSIDKKVTIKGELDVKSTVGGTKIDQYVKNNSLSEADVNSLITNSTVISDMLNLIDGAIETYFYTGIPTLSNLPASGWVEVATETNKEIYANHVGDLYYDKDTGKAYRFMKDGNTGIYSWITITDVDITKALADSSEALQTANVKRRIFYGTPTPPYDKGDLWVEATYPVGTTKTDAVNNLYYSEILYCNTAKALGSSFAITDWKLSNNYTGSINTVITDLNGYKYIKDALLNDTLTSGGLILSSLIALRDSSNDIQSGINGILNPEVTGKGIATWWGGKMIDGGFTPDITTTTVTDFATSLIRFDGSGYLANGNISWDTTGKVHANPLSFFVGPTNIGIVSSLFSTVPTNATSYAQVTKIHPTKPFDTLTADSITSNTFIGDLQGNASTTTKLQTPRTIWGQSFDGSGNVNGKMLFGTNDFSLATSYTDNWFDGTNYHPWYGYDHKPNTGIYSTTISDYFGLTLKTAIGILCIAFNGNVGIGKASPTYNLDVNGTFHASGVAVLDSGLNVTGNILATGNVGIGTTTPQYKLDVNGNARISSDLYADATVGTRNFASRTSGWQVNAQGAADFRNIYADELRVQAFTADISQALAGSDYLTKSVSKLSANFIVPAVNSTVRIIVDDIEGMPATQCFSNNDYIRFRAINRTAGLTVANAWGTVVLDTSYGTNGFSNGTQAYTFTCTSTSGAGLTVFKGSEVLDYGTSGSGLIARTTLDAQGSPYEQIATWNSDPSNGNNYTVHARLGNLNGIANCNGHGIYTDNGFFTGKIVIGDLTKTANFLSFDTVNGLQVKIGGTSVATTTDVSNSLTTANTNAQGYATTAQANAINTASSDATTKANTAYNNAVTYTNTQITATNNSITAAVNGIQIGGRNLLTNSKTFEGYSNYNCWSRADFDYQGLYVFYRNDVWLGLSQYYNVVAGKTYTFSANVSGDSQCNIFIYATKPGNSKIAGVASETRFGNITTWKRIGITFTPTESATLSIRVENSVKNSILNVCGYKLVEGNKDDGWSPAPEDVDAIISMAQSNAIGTAATNAASLYVTQTAYSSQVTILQNSINAKVSQTDFNALGTRVGTAESTITQHSTDIASKVAQTDYTGNTIASLINQTATTVAIQASKINLVGEVTFNSFTSDVQNTINGKATKDYANGVANTAYSNAIGAAATDATNKINNIQVGGRNLARNSKGDFTYTTIDIINYTQPLCRVYWVGNKNSNIVISGDIEYSNIVFTGTGPVIFRLQGRQDVGGWNEGIFSDLMSYMSNGSGKIHFSIKNNINSVFNNNYYDLGFRSDYITGTVTFRNLKVEYGNKETSWSPAPEDVDASISMAQSNAISTAATNAAALYVTQTAYSSQVNILKDSINAKVSQTDFNALGTRVGTAESTITQHSTDIASKVSLTDYTGNTIASLINQSASTVLINAQHINLVGAVTITSFDSSVTAAALGGATPSDVSNAQTNAINKVNAIQIGGRNLIIYSRLISGWINLNGTIDSDPNNMCDPNFYACSGNQSFTTSVYSNPTPKGGDAYIVFYDANKNYISYIRNFLNGSVYAPIFTSPSNAAYYRYSICYKENICKIEIGNKATDWTPAPEDVDSSISTAQQAAQTYATTNCVQVGLSNAPDAIKNQVLAAAHGNFSYIDGSSIYTGDLNANQVTAGYISADRIAANSLDASKIVANSITSTQINATSVAASIATVISLDASRITTGKLSADRIDSVSVVANGIAAHTIDAQSATISNLNVVNATVSGYFHAEYSGGAFVRMGQPTSSKILAIRADGLTGIDIGVYGNNSTGLSIIANLDNSRALDTCGSNYLMTRQTSILEGTWINGLSLCRVTITSGGDLGFGSLGWNHNGGYYMPNLIVSKASSDISVYIPADMPDGEVLIFRAAGNGTINVSSRDLDDRFQYGAQWDNWYRPYAPVAPGQLCIMVYDKSSHSWYSHYIS